jgi:phosphoserine phosphatase RsbU/P
VDNHQAGILIMSEHKEHCDFLSETLRAMGHEVTLTQTSIEVLDALQCCLTDDPDFDLVILDGHRPDILKEIRARHLCDDIPVIVVVGEDELEMVEQYIDMGAKDYLTTPLNPLLTQVRVNACLDETRYRQQVEEREKLLKIERDLQIAQQIQLSFLSSELPQFKGCEVASRFYPARSVAGDWYDAFYLANKRRLGIVIADVCDKGLPSALFMALCRSLIRAFAQQNYSLRWMDSALSGLMDSESDERRRSVPSTGTTALRAAVQLTNTYILENHAQANMFATLFFAVIDPTTGSLSYVNGGHNPPAILDKNGVIKARLKPTGPAVGIFPDATFGIDQADLEPGDILFTFTDGVPDAHAPDGKMFTDKRLMELISGAPVTSAKELLDRVDEAVHQHISTAIQFDDITMIAVRYG